MNLVRFTNVRVLRDHEIKWEDVWMASGKIVESPKRAELTHLDYVTVDGNGNIMAPGFIDVQLNGAKGIDFSTDVCTLDDVKYVGKFIMTHGVTAFCPTIVSSPQHKYIATLGPRLRRYSGSKADGATVLGYHLEGPFINKEKKGAHDINALASPVNGMPSLLERYGTLENVSIVTLAPELPGALECIKGLVENGVVASIGHTAANIDEAEAGLHAGSTMVTHMFNAMAPFHHRDPGVVGLLGECGRKPHYGIICDGIHTHPCSICVAYEAYPKGLMLVTDAMAAMGLADGPHMLGDMNVEKVGFRVDITGTDTLAGSAVDMNTCIKNFVKFTKCTKVEALEAASLHPAMSLGIATNKGHLGVGADADIVILNDNLDVMATFIAGEMCFRDESLTLNTIGTVGFFGETSVKKQKISADAA